MSRSHATNTRKEKSDQSRDSRVQTQERGFWEGGKGVVLNQVQIGKQKAISNLGMIG